MANQEGEENYKEEVEEGEKGKEEASSSTVIGLRRYDSLDIEAAKFTSEHSSKNEDWGKIMALAFQSLGVVYGDLGTSPLYVISSIFTDGIKHKDDILGVLSLIYYTITLIPLVKYALIVLQATDNGHGGTFALYSLICRHSEVGLIPSQQAEDGEVSNFKLELPNHRSERASKIKTALEGTMFAKYFLLIFTMLGTSMVIGDGILTPCISVLSAVSGLQQADSSLNEDKMAWISVAILILLFMLQRFGTDKVGYSFAPVITIWFISITGIGIFNFFKYDPWVFKAVNPMYIVDYFRRNGKAAWVSLGGVVLCVTGVEALFADVGHFSVKSIQVSMCGLVYPSLIFAYTGQASYLRENMGDVASIFYKSIPKSLYWPMFVVSVLAAIIASQAMISGTFSIIQQSLYLGCFPRVKIVQTSTKYEGQVYIPEMNYIIMIMCVLITLGFKNTVKIGNAYGIAVVFVMTLTSGYMVLIMLMIWKLSITNVILYVLVFGSMELVYLSSVLYKFTDGGYIPIGFAVFLVAVMLIWNYVYRMKYMYEMENRVPTEKVTEIVSDPSLRRIPGFGFFYSELVKGIPPIFNHYIANVPALHSVLVFVSVKSLPISRVPSDERFLFRHVGPRELFLFRCIARYGYKELRSNEQETFEFLLVQGLKDFIKQETINMNPQIEEDLDVVEREMKKGVIHLFGESEVVARRDSNWLKMIVIDYGYNCLKRNTRQQNEVFTIPRHRLLKVGMNVEL
ncbi:KUP system potassium uptake protein [Dioscorea alata]|uniref:KUP system potassium uptake protein n=2 Tax=Dioscorea alata TaxID=55571 RepID=A0ACB7VHE1_DIOAL|nr:KUP system potassium uptake protein [Dioscorea alata]KAH7673480.1 KUP system potassium uptake protein [Dioscorea alata]